MKYVPGISFRTDNGPFKVMNDTLILIRFSHFLFNVCSCAINFGYCSVTYVCIVKAAMQGFTQKIVQMMKDDRLFASQGGPIILSQVYKIITCFMGIFLKVDR